MTIRSHYDKKLCTSLRPLGMAVYKILYTIKIKLLKQSLKIIFLCSSTCLPWFLSINLIILTAQISNIVCLSLSTYKEIINKANNLLSVTVPPTTDHNYFNLYQKCWSPQQQVTISRTRFLGSGTGGDPGD